jgi:ferredoxin
MIHDFFHCDEDVARDDFRLVAHCARLHPCSWSAASRSPLDSKINSFLLRGTMANKADKWEPNVPGKFFVDQQCIDCDLCRETAPAFFTRHDEGGYSFVHKQPTTEEEISLCMEALEGCPVEAIGNDGDE